VQDFYPTPGTLSTCIYYTEKDPFTGESVHVAKDMEEKKMQRALMHYNKPENRNTVIKALQKAGRAELIGVLLGYNKDNRNESNQRVHKNHAGRKKAAQKRKK
jgi:radical SAM superfamily enzyme YgiQ (UPF0313 family)